jgi:pheromone shutdown protein TraB
MLHITDVPNFEYILIHCGNTDEHTAGCLLVGDSQENNQINENGFIGKSTQAYKRIYPRIAEALVNNKEVLITYKDIA